MVKMQIKSKIFFNLFVFIYIPIIFLLALVFLVSVETGIPVGVFTQDSAVTAGKTGLVPSMEFAINPFLGIISNLGILFWCVTSSVCLFTFFLIIQKKKSRKNDKAPFLGFFGLITLILLLDDLFLVHESLAPNLFIPEKIVYACYVAMVFFGIIKFRKIVLQTEWTVLCLTLMFFFLSLVIDTFGIGPNMANLSFILEDGFKFLGIASWSVYFTRVAFQFAK